MPDVHEAEVSLPLLDRERRPKGDPTLNLHIDASTSGGVLNLVRDDPTTGVVVLEVDENGKISEPNPIVLHRSSAPGFTTGSIVEFTAGSGAGTRYASLERGGTGDSFVLKRGSSGIEALEVDSSHNFKFKDTGGTTRLTIAAGSSGGEPTLGDASGSRGVVTLGRDSSGTPRAGILKLVGEGGDDLLPLVPRLRQHLRAALLPRRSGTAIVTVPAT